MNGDITFTRKQGEQNWMPLVVHREVVHHIDRKLKKEVANHVQPLVDYLNIMVDMVEEKYHWGKVFTNEDYKHLKNYNGQPSDKWVELAENYRRKIKEVTWNGNVLKETFHKDRLKDLVLKDATVASQPFKQVEIPLGQLCYDRYRSWVI
jgi:hypothetical protein